ncbi:6-bladed beta-propeller [Gemmatimonadota bacterium]
MLRMVPALLLVVSMSACSDSDVSSGHSFRAWSEGGITISKTTGGPKYEGELFEYIEVVRLNQDDSVVESLLGMPFPYFMDDGGAFYVPDFRPMRVVCFDAEGEYSHTIGREGEGPGEFRYLEITELEDDILTVFDSRIRRATRFNTDGTLIGTLITDYQKSGTAFGYSLHGLLEDERGRMYTYWVVRDRVDIYQMVGVAVDVLDSEGEVLFEIETPMIRTMYEINSGGIVAGVGLSYAGSPVIWHLDDGRFIRTTGETPDLDIFSVDGDLIGRIETGLVRESTARAEEEHRAYYTGRIQDATNPRSRAFNQAMLEDLRLPEFKALWSDLVVDESGYIWLKHSEKFYSDQEPAVCWRVLSPEGEYLGETRFAAVEASISHGHMLTIQENEETGVQDLIVYDIRPVARGLRYPD